MNDNLRGPLVNQLEALATDLAIGRHGDPHLAFAVLCYPDREPAVLIITGNHSATDLSHLQARDDAKDPGDSAPFPTAEFQEAQMAMSDADMGIHIAPFHMALDPDATIGTTVADTIRDAWKRRRLAPITKALAQADHEKARPAECPYCHQRFTQRGLPMHLSKSRICSQRHQLAQQATL